MIPFDDPLALFALMKERLYAAVLCDALDQVGYRQQAMRADIRPLFPEAVVVGRACTMQSVDVYEFEENAYEKEIAAVDSLQPGDVLVASTQQSTRTCLWGELLSTASTARGANGAIIDGYRARRQADPRDGVSRLRHRHAPRRLGRSQHGDRL